MLFRSERIEYAGRPRSTPDPDDYTSGFCTWSGTSFAAPVLAGQIAAALAADPAIGKVDRDAAVARARAAMAATIAEWQGQL